MLVNVRPIGYWLKHLDGLIEATFARCLEDAGISRRHWQALNAVRQDAAESLRPFWADGGAEAIDDLVRREWIERDGSGYRITALGTETLTAVESRVSQIRARLTDGLTAEQYTATVKVLAIMAANLEGAREN
jgi:hypothetical protein